MITNYTDVDSIKKLGNIYYIFNDYKAKEKKRKSDRLFRQTTSDKRKYLTLLHLTMILFIIFVPIFAYMFFKLIIQDDIISNVSFRFALIMLIPVVCGLPVSAMIFKENYYECAKVTKENLYTNAESFFVFKNKDKNILDAKMSFKEGKAILNIYYEDNDEKLGLVTKVITFNDFSVVRTHSVQSPLLNIDKGIYYIPCAKV
jgi:hypothetical protein